MENKLASLAPIKGAKRSIRQRLTIKDELFLAFLPTVTVLVVFALVEALSTQRLLFASLASSAFLIYLDPEHGTNSIKTLIISQMAAATIGLVTYLLLGPEYHAAGLSMVLTITVMIIFDAMHPPAVATTLSFAFRAGNESNLLLFGMAVGITAILVVLERSSLWLLSKHLNKKGKKRATSKVS